MRRFRSQTQSSPSPSTVALTLAERAQLVEAAPAEQGDHVVNLLRPGQAEVFGVVRNDAGGRRLVAVAPTADEAQAKARPVADRWAPVQHASPAGAQAAGGAAPTSQAQQRAAEASLDAERAEYRRACIAAGIKSPQLV